MCWRENTIYIYIYIIAAAGKHPSSKCGVWSDVEGMTAIAVLTVCFLYEPHTLNYQVCRSASGQLVGEGRVQPSANRITVLCVVPPLPEKRLAFGSLSGTIQRKTLAAEKPFTYFLQLKIIPSVRLESGFAYDSDSLLSYQITADSWIENGLMYDAVTLNGGSGDSYLLQIHLIRTVPGFDELSGPLFLQRHHHDVVTPTEKARQSLLGCVDSIRTSIKISSNQSGLSNPLGMTLD